MYMIQVDIPEIIERHNEVFLFDDIHEAEQFRDHLNNLYRLNVNIGQVAFDTYDSAIQHMVEVFGPSEE